MNHRLRTSRFALPSLASAVVLLLWAGCQSTGQNDLVTRELRTQEDQIYAMEDYLAQYQQLLCQYRAENAALRRQIRAGGGEPLPAQSPSSRDMLPLKQSQPEKRSGPAFRSPDRMQPTQPPEQAPSSEEIDIEVIEPAVPALEETTQDEPRIEVRGQNPPDSYAELPTVAAASYDEPEPTPNLPGEAALAAGNPAGAANFQTLNDLVSWNNSPPQFVRIEGKVIHNEPGHGPRLQVDVEPLSVNGQPTHFAGPVSLMIIETRGNAEPPLSLARWDFSAADAQAALDETPHRPTMRFHLELPPGTPIDGNTEFWVRLMPETGDKVLQQASIDLSQSGQFASTDEGRVPREGNNPNREGIAVGMTATADRPNSVAQPATIDPADDEGWTIARPDQPIQSRPADESIAQWRPATQPIPVVAGETAMATSTPVQPEPQFVQQASFIETISLLKAPLASPPAPKAHIAPMWTPDRGKKSTVAAGPQSTTTRTAAAPTRPAWSPMR